MKIRPNGISRGFFFHPRVSSLVFFPVWLSKYAQYKTLPQEPKFWVMEERNWRGSGCNNQDKQPIHLIGSFCCALLVFLNLDSH